MDTLTKARLFARTARWRLTWSKHDGDYRAPHLPQNPRFMTAHEAAALLRRPRLPALPLRSCPQRAVSSRTRVSTPGWRAAPVLAVAS